ncbi:Serine/arginine repetitive matrix protein 2 [Pseudocyphellaria aurata]|nr:Serine/arginine repetitive matrix protein 2 [Pseudocyphellaria aurata]
MTTKPTPIILYGHTNPDGTIEFRPELAEVERAPGEVWVEKLPGHSRAAFVRKRKSHKSAPFGLTTLAEALGSASRSRSVETIERTFPVPSAPAQTSFILEPVAQSPGGQTTVTQQPVTSHVQVAPTGVITGSGPPPAVLVKQTCISCGNVRSPRYQLRHFLKPGEMPRISICRKCAKKETSSEDSGSSYERYRRKKRRHRNRHSSETTDDGHGTRQRSRRSGRYHSPSRHESHRSTTQSDSTDRTRPAFMTTRASRRPRRSTPERIRIVRRVRYIEPAHQSRSQGRSRTSTSRHHPTERSGKSYVYHGGDLDNMSNQDEIPRKHKAHVDRQYTTVVEPEMSNLRRRSSSVLVEQKNPLNVVRQEFDKGDPVFYTSRDDDHRTTRSRSFEHEPSVKVEVDHPSRSVRLVRIAPEQYEQSLRSRSGRSVQTVQEFDETRPRSQSVRTVHVAQDSDESCPRSGSVRAFHAAQDSDESRPRSRSVRVLRVVADRGDPRSFATAGADPKRVVLDSRYRRPPPINVHQYTEVLVPPRSTRRDRVPETSDSQFEISDDADDRDFILSNDEQSLTHRSYRVVRTLEAGSHLDHEREYPSRHRSSSPDTPHSYVRTRTHSSPHHASRSRSASRRRTSTELEGGNYVDDGGSDESWGY